MIHYALIALTMTAVFAVSTIRADNVAMDQIIVMDSLKSASHNELTLTRELMDEIRGFHDRAASELTGIDAGGSGFDRSVNSLLDYFNLQMLANDFRDMAGLTSYHITSEIMPDGDGIQFRARIFAIDETDPVAVVTVKGKNGEFEPLLHEAAQGILGELSPYLVAIHLYHQELASGDLEFPQTRAMLDRQLHGPRRLKRYLAFDLLGRLHRVRAELDTKLAPAQRTAELDTAAAYLEAALAVAPGLFYANANLGMVFADRGESALADQFFAKAVAIAPNQLVARQRWAETLAAQGRNRDAVIQYVAAVELAPEDIGLRDHLAGLYLAMNHPAAAREQWQAVLAIDPGNQGAIEKLRSLAP